MKSTFTTTVKLTLDHDEVTDESKHVTTDLYLQVSDNLQKSAYLKDDLPTRRGVTPITHCLVQGLILNIHKAHQEGWFDSAKHLRYIIAELEKGFSTVAIVTEEGPKK